MGSESTVYRIAKWDEVFENSSSRKVHSLQWVPLPVSFNSAGYESMVLEFGDRAPAIYGAWAAVLKIAASAPIRGVLATSKGVGFTASQLHFRSHFPAAIFEELIAWASREDVGWLEPVDESTVFSMRNGNRDAIGTPSRRHPDGIPTPSGCDTARRQDRQDREGNRRTRQTTNAERDGPPSSVVVDQDLISRSVASAKRMESWLSAVDVHLDADTLFRAAFAGEVTENESFTRELTTDLRKRSDIRRPKKWVASAIATHLQENGFDPESVMEAVPCVSNGRSKPS